MKVIRPKQAPMSGKQNFGHGEVARNFFINCSSQSRKILSLLSYPILIDNRESMINGVLYYNYSDGINLHAICIHPITNRRRIKP